MNLNNSPNEPSPEALSLGQEADMLAFVIGGVVVALAAVVAVGLIAGWLWGKYGAALASVFWALAARLG